MPRQLPPFSAVRAFEAAARHLSFKKAAEELCLSPSAISHQIRALEEYLATSLFDRGHNSISLSLTGQAYAGRLTHLLDGMDAATREARVGPATELRVISTPGFAARWLLPRMGGLDFADRVRLRVSTGAPNTDFATNDADLVIQWVDDPSPGNRVEPLLRSARYPVASPDFVAAHGITKPADLAGATLMYDETMDAWGEWFQEAGVTAPAKRNGPTYPNCEYATTAAEQGLGVSLAYDAVVRNTLKSGRLVRLFDEVTMPFTIYSICTPEARQDEPLIRAFSDWLLDAAARDGTLPEADIVRLAV